MLTDIGTEELAHMEMVSAIVHQLTKDLTPQEIMEGNFEKVLCRSYFWPCGLSLPVEYPLMLASSRVKVIQLPIWLRIWQRSKSKNQFGDNILRLVHDHDVCDLQILLRQNEKSTISKDLHSRIITGIRFKEFLCN